MAKEIDSLPLHEFDAAVKLITLQTIQKLHGSMQRYDERSDANHVASLSEHLAKVERSLLVYHHVLSQPDEIHGISLLLLINQLAIQVHALHHALLDVLHPQHAELLLEVDALRAIWKAGQLDNNSPFPDHSEVYHTWAVLRKISANYTDK